MLHGTDGIDNSMEHLLAPTVLFLIAPGGELQLRHVIVLRGVSWHVLYLPIKLPIFSIAPYFQQSIFPVLSILIYFMMIPRSFHFLNSSQGASAI